jgi:glyoxylase-like metal-dependent hydrolase (beta-lactamase superfamily II)
MEDKMKELIPGFYNVTGLTVGRVYVIVGPDGLTVIDASMPGSAKKIARQIEALGYKVADVKHILITHAHNDHIGGLPELKKLTSAEVIAHEVEKPIVEGEVPVDRTVTDGEVLGEVMGGLQVVFTPGHSYGHIAFWQPDKRLLITGDAMMNFLGRLSLPFAAFTPDMDEAKRSIKRLAELDVEVACFGHGPPIMANAAPAIRQFAERVGAV